MEENGRVENNIECSENLLLICVYCRLKSVSWVCKDCSVVFYCLKFC